MKSLLNSILCVIILLTSISFAQKANPQLLLDKYAYKMKINDVFIVYADYEVTYKLSKKKQGAITDIAIDTLKPGVKFVLQDAIVYTEKDFVTEKPVEYTHLIIKTEEGRIRTVMHPEYIHTKCYKEGESNLPQKKYAMMESALNYKSTSLWIIFGIAVLVTMIYHYQIKRIDKLFYKLTNKERKIYNPGKSVFLASGIVGALSGIVIFFNADLMKEFYMYAPMFAFPSNGSWVVKYYWALQFLPIPFVAWGVYRSIIEFGVKFGLIRSLFLLIGCAAFFWTGVVIALITIALIVFMLMAKMGKGIADSDDGSYNQYTKILQTDGTYRETIITRNKDQKEIKRRHVD
jgi:hypothetical protein